MKKLITAISLVLVPTVALAWGVAMMGGGVEVGTTDFVFTVETTGAEETFTIPCKSGTFNATVDWGDETATSEITTYNDADLAHEYASAGEHEIRISGTFPNIYFNNTGDKLKIISVSNLGDVGWTTLENAFYGCSNMMSFTAGNTDTSSVTNMYAMMYGWSSMTSSPDLSSFDTSSVANMGYMMRGWSSMGEVGDIGVKDFDISALNGTGDLDDFASDITFSTAAYDDILISWAAQTVFSGMNPDFGSSKYTSGGTAETARTSLINDDSWTIDDGGEAP